MYKSDNVNSPPTHTNDSPDNHASTENTSKQYDDDVQYTPV